VALIIPPGLPIQKALISVQRQPNDCRHVRRDAYTGGQNRHDFLVDMVTTVPDRTTSADIEAIHAREAARSRELAAQGPTGYLCVIIRRHSDVWKIAHYQVSYLAERQ
jgi:hypothetical protein